MKYLYLLHISTFLSCFLQLSSATPSETAVLWITKSSEYQAVCEQVYSAAEEKVLPLAEVANTSWAIVMDIDETVLNNAQYQVELNAKGKTHSQQAWSEWVNRKAATPIPGVKTFIAKLRKIPGGRIIFISNRYASNAEPTRQNLSAHGLLGKDDVFLLRKERADKKTLRRKEVFEGNKRMSQHGKLKILAWFGDASNDFPDNKDLDWGQEKFMLPNPVYGGWLDN